MKFALYISKDVKRRKDVYLSDHEGLIDIK